MLPSTFPIFWCKPWCAPNPLCAARAIALIDGIPPLWSVAAANEAALQAGIKLGMAKQQVEQFSNMEIRQRSRGQEEATHTAPCSISVGRFPLRVEETAPDTVSLDLTGLDSLFGSEEAIAQQLEAARSPTSD